MADTSKGFDAHDSAGVAAHAAELVADGCSFAVQYIDQGPATGDALLLAGVSAAQLRRNRDDVALV